MSRHLSWSTHPACIFTFRSPHSAFLDLSLSRRGSSWFMTYPRAYGMVEYTGQRIHARLSAPISDVGERPRFFWYNSDWNSQGSMANPLNILVESDPPPIRPTGRTRMEKPHGKTDGEEIVCQEMEVLVPDNGLLRQCYYCLEWEDNSPRFSRCRSNDDIYWCSSCQMKGQLIASSWSGLRQALGYNTVRTVLGEPVTKDSLYA